VHKYLSPNLFPPYILVSHTDPKSSCKKSMQFKTVYDTLMSPVWDAESKDNLDDLMSAVPSGVQMDSRDIHVSLVLKIE
jgi:hypothetical protein